jgi:beta-glucanase (GH16 family)
MRVASAPAPNWQLVWSDEFPTNKLDLTKWNIGNASEQNFDGGINYYDPSNVYISNHHLVIRATSHVKSSNGKTYYSSGRVTTKGKFAFLYGKLEVRAKLPGTRGLWPAIWMLQSDGSWPPEIDVMELLGSDPHTVYMTLHYGSFRKQREDQSSYAGPDYTADYHTFSVEWTPGNLQWVIDGVVRKTVTQNVPSKAMYLRINTSIGGDWPGNPTKQTVLPQYLDVEYVRVYRQVN